MVNEMKAHCLHFQCRAVEPVRWHEHKGASIRGAFYKALTDGFCMNRPVLIQAGCHACPLVATCPVALLVSTLDPRSERGQQAPRPYAIEPPLDGRTFYEPGDTFIFGMTLFARAVNLFPYVVLSMRRMEDAGIGMPIESAPGRRRRGRFQVLDVWSENPLTGERQSVMQQGNNMVQSPQVPVTHDDVERMACALPKGGELKIDFLTPTRLVDGGQLVMRPHFRPLFQRLLERLSGLAKTFCDAPLELDFSGLIEEAKNVELAQDETHWVELKSYSSRLGRHTPIGGFVGTATYRASDWQALLSWLAWGQIVHVGKDAVKGNGWYRIVV